MDDIIKINDKDTIIKTVPQSFREKLFKSLNKLNAQSPLNKQAGTGTVMYDTTFGVQYGLAVKRGEAYITFVGPMKKELPEEFKDKLVILVLPLDKLDILL